VNIEKRKTDQETCSNTKDIGRNLGKNGRRRSTFFHWKHSKSVSAASFRKWTSRILEHLPIIGTKYLMHLFSVLLFKTYFPTEWKFAQFVSNLKPRKPPNELTSYWPISLLSIASKVFEMLLLKTPLPMIENNRTVSHEFDLRQRHSKIQQTYWIVQRMNEAIEIKIYYSAAFLYIPQVFNKVWHIWLLEKLRLSFLLCLKSYLQTDISL
jgi:hypothetical protein